MNEQKNIDKLKSDLNTLQADMQLIDFNEMSESESEDMKKLREQAEEKIKHLEKIKESKSPVSDYLGDFVGDISERAKTPPISTGFQGLDNILDGGLFEGLYCLGAVTSAGKSAIVMQIADQIAKTGQDVLIFALEMSRFELMARSISRHTYIRARKQGGRIAWAKTARGITDGSRHEKYCKQEMDIITDAITDYSQYTDHLYIFEGIGNIGVKEIRERVEEMIRETGKKPVVIIDYLQILAPTDVRATDKQNTDKAILELKRISRDNKIPVIAISSLNRESYKKGSEHKGAVTLDSFKESGAVEYSCDVLLGWQFQNAGKDVDLEEEYKKTPREMQIVVLKNRSGERGRKLDFNYFPMFNYAEETGEGQEKRRNIR